MSIKHFDYIIIGGGVAGLSAATVISNKTESWALVERDYPVLKSNVIKEDFQRIKSNIPSSNERNWPYWLTEFEEEGWFSSSNNFSWGRVPVMGGRSNLWSGWSPLIKKENLIRYVGGEVSRTESLWDQYIRIRNFLKVEERPTSFFDQPPYSDPESTLEESETLLKLQGVFSAENIETTFMPRPEHSKYNSLLAYAPSIKNLEKHICKGTVVKINNGQDRLKSIIVTNRNGSSSYTLTTRSIFLSASAYETVRLVADAFDSDNDRPKEIGQNIHDHVYVRNAIVFKIPENSPETFNTKLYAKPFVCPEVPGYKVALQISATRADQLVSYNYPWVGTIAIVGEVPSFSHGALHFSTSSRDKLDRLLPHVEYGYRTELKTYIDKIVLWLSYVLKQRGLEILSESNKLSRPGESLHEMGGFGDKDFLCDGAIRGLNSVYVCDGSGYGSFGPEHPCLAINAFAKYVADTATERI